MQIHQTYLSPFVADLQRCIQCGFCLPTCPTYNLTGKERSSPRGRIQMMKGIASGELSMSELFAHEMFFCLDCRACETACPAGVQYSSVLSSSRSALFQIDEKKIFSLSQKILNGIFLSTARIKFVAYVLRILQKSGVMDALHQSGIVKIFSSQLDEMLLLSPKIADEFSDKYFDKNKLKYKSHTHQNGNKRMRVGVPLGCVTNVAFPEVNIATVNVLEKLGYEIILTENISCCGALHHHNGDEKNAKILALQVMNSFEHFQCDIIASNTAGCGTAMKEYGKLFSGDSVNDKRAIEFSKKVKDISEIIAESTFDEKANSTTFSKKVNITYHDACHLAHGQKITEEPRKIIKQFQNVTLIEMKESSWCCGSAGVYNITHFSDAFQLLRRKMENIKQAQTDIVVTGNVGCMQQLRYGADKCGVNVKVMHTVEFVRQMMEESN
ncbi:MAG: (Fe-S)-binding protein [Bacteroidota bacterium]